MLPEFLVELITDPIRSWAKGRTSIKSVPLKLKNCPYEVGKVLLYLLKRSSSFGFYLEVISSIIEST